MQFIEEVNFKGIKTKKILKIIKKVRRNSEKISRIFRKFYDNWANFER